MRSKYHWPPHFGQRSYALDKHRVFNEFGITIIPPPPSQPHSYISTKLLATIAVFSTLERIPSLPSCVTKHACDLQSTTRRRVNPSPPPLSPSDLMQPPPIRPPRCNVTKVSPVVPARRQTSYQIPARRVGGMRRRFYTCSGDDGLCGDDGSQWERCGNSDPVE